MKYYDVDGDGQISYEEFLTGLRYVTFNNIIRDPLSERKLKMVERAF